MGSESMMSKKAEGTCPNPAQFCLLFNCDSQLATRICCHNRHYAEHAGYAFGKDITWTKEMLEKAQNPDLPQTTTYYDSITGKSLFKAPVGRSIRELLVESEAHGWPSFRDQEVDWTNVRVLPNGEVISVDGTHLGHNLPDKNGNRYCINLVCIAGNER